MSSASVGEPVTKTASSKVADTVRVSPAFRRLFCAPVEADSTMAPAASEAGVVSTVSVKLALSGPTLPARSVNCTFRLCVEPLLSTGVSTSR